MNAEVEGRRVRELARTEAYHRGKFRLEDVVRHVPHLPAQFVADQCELAGFNARSTNEGG